MQSSNVNCMMLELLHTVLSPVCVLQLCISLSRELCISLKFALIITFGHALGVSSPLSRRADMP